MKDVGDKIRQYRKEKGLTLEEMAQRSGLSRSFLSEAERGHSSMTLTSLQRIAEALDLPLASFFQPPELEPTGPRIVRAQDRAEFRIAGAAHITFASLGASFPGKQLEPTLTTLLPGRNHVVPYAHPGEEFTWVLEGTLTVLLGDKEYELGPGDCIHMPSTAPHGWENRTDKAVRVLCVSTPPVFQSSVSPNA